MTYYRLAVQDRQTARWTWKTTPITSVQAVLQLLRIYRALPQGSIRIFTASSKEDLSQMLSRQKNNLASSSVTATQFLRERNIAVPKRAPSAAEQSVSAPAAQPGESVATWAKDIWEKHVAMRTAQAVQQGATVAPSSSLGESLATTALPASPGMSLLEQKRLEIERGQGGDHDTAYRFTLSLSMPQWLAWIRLQTRVRAGELPS